ncbi:HAD-IA family hydrolase [Candidatus Saccharibacteria bacterium]|nr:HAD-IA family hydrolase [Candidatus Saccharibacteria bacterium]MCB9821190.1 HAD-IA family hydrolase [Candidatus Nomurabacteria bacterium]
MIKAVLFDCFGVLVEDGLGIMSREFQPTQNQWQEMQVYRLQADQGKIDSQQVQQEFARILNVSYEQIANSFGRLHKNYSMFEIVKSIKKQNLKTGLLSNVSPGFIERYFSPDEKGLFDTMLLSFELGFTKPDKRFFQEAELRLGVDSSECIFIDDNQQNVAAAEALGMLGHVYGNLNDLGSFLRVNGVGVEL